MIGNERIVYPYPEKGHLTDIKSLMHISPSGLQTDIPCPFPLSTFVTILTIASAFESYLLVITDFVLSSFEYFWLPQCHYLLSLVCPFFILSVQKITSSPLNSFFFVYIRFVTVYIKALILVDWEICYSHVYWHFFQIKQNKSNKINLS